MGGGTCQFKISDELQHNDRLPSHRDTRTNRRALIAEMEQEGPVTEYNKTIGANKCPVSFDLQDDQGYHSTFQLLKALREHGGGGTSVYHVSAETRAAERAHQAQDKQRMKENATLHQGQFPRDNVTGIGEETQPDWVERLTMTSANDALYCSTLRRQGRAYSTMEKLKARR